MTRSLPLYPCKLIFYIYKPITSKTGRRSYGSQMVLNRSEDELNLVK